MQQLAKLFFVYPGRAIIWFQYMFPNKGDVIASRRRVGNGTLEVLFSLGFWLVVGIIVGNIIAKAAK